MYKIKLFNTPINQCKRTILKSTDSSLFTVFVDGIFRANFRVEERAPGEGALAWNAGFEPGPLCPWDDAPCPEPHQPGSASSFKSWDYCYFISLSGVVYEMKQKLWNWFVNYHVLDTHTPCAERRIGVFDSFLRTFMTFAVCYFSTNHGEFITP